VAVPPAGQPLENLGSRPQGRLKQRVSQHSGPTTCCQFKCVHAMNRPNSPGASPVRSLRGKPSVPDEEGVVRDSITQIARCRRVSASHDVGPRRESWPNIGRGRGHRASFNRAPPSPDCVLRWTSLGSGEGLQTGAGGLGSGLSPVISRVSEQRQRAHLRGRQPGSKGHRRARARTSRPSTPARAAARPWRSTSPPSSFDATPIPKSIVNWFPAHCEVVAFEGAGPQADR
jgi:hypothetical protein